MANMAQERFTLNRTQFLHKRDDYTTVRAWKTMDHNRRLSNPASFPTSVRVPGQFEPISHLMLSFAQCNEYSEFFQSQMTMVQVSVKENTPVQILVKRDNMAECKKLLTKKLSKGVSGDWKELVQFIPWEASIMYTQRGVSDWIQDYGPMVYVSEEGEWGLLSTMYFPVSVNDALSTHIEVDKYSDDWASDMTSVHFAQGLGQKVPHHYLPAWFEWGNFLPNGQGTCLTSDKAVFNGIHYMQRIMGMSYPSSAFRKGSKEYVVEEQRLKQLLNEKAGCKNTVILPSHPEEVTGHVDMVMMINEYDLDIGTQHMCF
jgi:hypothetical protein